MSNELIKYAFTGGEISPQLFGRSDLEQYDLGMALARNWFVDFRGGLSTRAGFEFVDFIKNDDLETKFFEFRFSPDLSNIYGLLFGHNYVRFFQDGAYVLEADKVITGIAGNVVTSAGHGYANGDWVKIAEVGGITNINGRTFEISNVTANTFQLKTLPTVVNFVPSGAYTSGGVVARIYTVTTPYASTDLAGLHAIQRRDLLRLTHNDFPIKNLTRMDHTNWTLTNEIIGSNHIHPTGLTVASTAAGAAGAIFTVTAVLDDGTETVMAPAVMLNAMVNYTVTAGAANINWDIFPNAVSYNVYRSIIVSDGLRMTRGFDLGFIGNVVGTQFTDSNIIPDFTKTPPQANNPFAAGTIESVSISNGGAGYNGNSTITISDPTGTGFIASLVVDFSNKIVGVDIIAGGINYTAPVVVLGGPGAGAVLTANASPLEGIYPSISAIFQQRQIYASTILQPLTLWGSQPKRLPNFDFSKITNESDSYEFEVDSAEVAPLRHLVPMRGGLVLMSQTGIWQLTGGSQGVVTPTNALADPQTYTGVSDVFPLKIGTDLLYIEGKGFSVRLLSYNEYARVYTGEDKSIVSNHFFENGKRIIRWAFSENPFKVVYGVRSDGQLLAFTIVKEEKVFSWTLCSTQGLVKDVISLQEGDLDRAYITVQRKINGRWTKFIERMSQREFQFSEDSFCVDSGLSLGASYPNAGLTVAAAEGNDVTFTASSAVFAPGDVGKIIRAGGGKASIQTYVSATVVKCNIVRPIMDILPQSDIVLDQAAGTWTMDAKVTTIGGLWHLEGSEVSVLGDGNVFPRRVVTDGQITLEAGVTRCVVGLPYQCLAQSLPPTVSDAIIEARRKRVVGVAVRVNDTRGLKAGRSLDSLYPLRYRTNELYGEPTELVDGMKVQMIDPEWSNDGQVYFVQDDPLPATLLCIVTDMEVGDDQ